MQEKKLPSLPQKGLASYYTSNICAQITVKAAEMWVQVPALPHLTLTQVYHHAEAYL